MEIKEFILFVIPMLLFGYLVEVLLRKKLKIKKKPGWFDRSVNTFHNWTLVILIVLYIAASITLDFVSTKYLIFIFITISQGVRVFMEWKFEREGREYFISLWGFSWFLVFTVSLIILF
ncbi:DUF4181 domain-containing protein [Bacillus xiapuensis]|uniref:DUF4181 domain-containing protein n=1 Tax=Bacillus xiapuensis TaxID=2014075 RepID=A0ABU6N4M9_9BACI|nr:DUF4181 domain-containing protein [Bacillus xiapuensis]